MTIDPTSTEVQGRVPVTVLRLAGALDASNYRDLIDEVREACTAGARDILLDLVDLSHVSISGLVALQSIAALMRGEEPPDPDAGWPAIHAIRRDRDQGLQPHFKLLSPQPYVDRVLEAVGFKRYLEVFTDLEMAVTSFRSKCHASIVPHKESPGCRTLY